MTTLTEQPRYCGSTLAFGSCKFASGGHPFCGASYEMHHACEYRFRGYGKPQESVVIVAHGQSPQEPKT